MQPESSDGFASVGTVLPKEEAALLPGGLFVVSAGHFARGTEYRIGIRQLEQSSLFCGIAAKPVE